VAGPYLVERGLDSGEVGWFLALPAMAAMALGALAGGRLSDRLGRRRAVRLFQALFALAVLGLAALDALGAPPAPWSLLVLSCLYLFIGLFTASSYALLMDLTDARLAATQYSVYMAATNGCEAWSVFTVGRLIPSFGHATAFAMMSLASLAALVLVPRPPRVTPSGVSTSPPGEDPP
jgi:MFS family permease